MKIRTCMQFVVVVFSLIQSLVKIGLNISASFYYQLEPVATLQICPTPRTCGPALKTCADLYQNFPASHIDIFAWYQTRSLKWCKWGWFVSIFVCLFLLDWLVDLAFLLWCVYTISLHMSQLVTTPSKPKLCCVKGFTRLQMQLTIKAFRLWLWLHHVIITYKVFIKRFLKEI